MTPFATPAAQASRMSWWRRARKWPVEDVGVGTRHRGGRWGKQSSVGDESPGYSHGSAAGGRFWVARHEHGHRQRVEQRLTNDLHKQTARRSIDG